MSDNRGSFAAGVLAATRRNGRTEARNDILPILDKWAGYMRQLRS
jgi:hypothetical protein